MMKIALISPHFPPHRGGVEVHAYHLSAELAARGHDVRVFTQHAEPDRTWWTSGFEVRAYQIRLGGDTYPIAPILWRRLLREGNQFDVVHAHNYHGLAALAGGFSHRRPFVFTPHYHGAGRAGLAQKLHHVYTPLGRALFARASQVICVSNAERELVVRDHPEVASKIVVIPNGLPQNTLAAPQPWAMRERLVATVGRLDPYKRLDFIIEAMSQLPDDVRLIVVGTGRNEVQLTSHVTELGLKDRVTLAGGLSDEAVAQLLAKTRVVVSASEREAFGMVVLEARQSGARVVASALAAHRELAELDPAKGVHLWDPDTAAYGLAHAIGNALASDDPGLLKSAPHWPDVAASTEEVYERALARVPRPELRSLSKDRLP
jgi:glycosyltransferase involved in cell wall biosynthesis